MVWFSSLRQPGFPSFVLPQWLGALWAGSVSAYITAIEQHPLHSRCSVCFCSCRLQVSCLFQEGELESRHGDFYFPKLKGFLANK